MNDKYWEEEIETMPREKLRELQLQRLQILPIISRCFKNTALRQTVSGQ